MPGSFIQTIVQQSAIVLALIAIVVSLSTDLYAHVKYRPNQKTKYSYRLKYLGNFPEFLRYSMRMGLNLLLVFYVSVFILATCFLAWSDEVKSGEVVLSFGLWSQGGGLTETEILNVIGCFHIFFVIVTTGFVGSMNRLRRKWTVGNIDISLVI